MKLVVKDIIKETNDTLSLSFKNGNLFKKLAYKPGQFLTIHVPVDKVVHKRAYSFSSSPFVDKDLKITVKRVEKGLISNYIHDAIKIGDKFEVDKPTGSFYVDPNKDNKKQYVLFAGGSGITPIFSIVQSVLLKEPDSKVLLIYANKNEESIIFCNEIETLEDKYPEHFAAEHILAEPSGKANNMLPGLISTEVLEKIFTKHQLQFDNHHYMICGPFGYMDKVKELLKAQGISRDKIKIEVFKSPKIKVTGKDLISNVTLKVNNETHQFQARGDKSILQQAMSQNIVLPYSCRSGMCASCKATCTSGEITMTEGHFLDESEVSNGAILTCISYPASEEIEIEV